jgi:uncharacterized protein
MAYLYALYGRHPDSSLHKMSAPSRALELLVLPDEFIVARFAADAPVPAWATPSRFCYVARTPDELSIVCSREHVPENLRTGARWRAFKVRGPLALGEVGVLAAIATPLAGARISIFVVSTFDTDYVLVNSDKVRGAINALEEAGHKVTVVPQARDKN